MVTYRQLFESCKSMPGEFEAYIFLIIEIADISRTQLYVLFDTVVPEDTLDKIHYAFALYSKSNIPPQYIVGHSYFLGLKIFVNQHVLIPRKETEELVTHALEYLKPISNPSIIDVGTGSGCIAVALKKNRIDATMIAIDNASAALEKAKQNAEYHQVDIIFLENDLLTNITHEADLIISNPPYVRKEDFVMSSVHQYEPHSALYSEDNGLYHCKKIIIQAKKVLKESGAILLEINQYTSQELKTFVKKHYRNSNIITDLQGNDRFMMIR